jgi:hypothetical protein
MRLGVLVSFGAIALSLGSLACAPVRVDYMPVDPIHARAPTDPEDVEVYPQDGPDWDYVLAGDFQEESRDSVPGGRAGLVALLRQLGAEEGCDGVIVGGNVGRFIGEYVTAGRHGRRRWSDGSSANRSARPLFERFGVHAQCVARMAPLGPWAHRIPLAPRPPDEFFSF